jgi:hypothetical protein
VVTALPRPRRRATGALVGAAIGAAATLLALLAWAGTANRDQPAPAPIAAAPGPAPSTTTPCEDQPYRPCGQPVAAFTDGVRCINDHADYDKDRTNGCEAAPDGVDGQRLDRPITANLVPATDIDRYPFHVDDGFDLFCDGSLTVTLTAPKGAAMHLDLMQGTTIKGSTTSAHGVPGRVVLDDPSCLGDDSTDLTARVSWSGDARSAANYRLERSGSF